EHSWKKLPDTILNRLNTEFHRIMEGRDRQNSWPRGKPLEGVGSDFGGARRPVRWRKRDAPEIGGRLDEFQTNFRATVRRGIGTDYAAELLFVGLGVFQDDDLAGLDFQGEIDQAAVGIHNRRMGHLRNGLFVRTTANHLDRDAQEDALAAAPVVHYGQIGRKRGHTLRHVYPVMEGRIAGVNGRKVQGFVRRKKARRTAA